MEPLTKCDYLLSGKDFYTLYVEGVEHTSSEEFKDLFTAYMQNKTAGCYITKTTHTLSPSGINKAVEEIIDIPEPTKKIIAFVGRQGSGKSYRCEQLVKNEGYTTFAFADALRRIAFATLGISYDWGMQHYDELKQTPLYNGLTFRNILENLGTEGIRRYDNDFWVKCLLKDIKESDSYKICISDLRFYNEYAGLRDFCEENDFELSLVFTDFRSNRYEANNHHASARLANFLCEVGYKDGDLIKDSDMQTYIDSMEELNKK